MMTTQPTPQPLKSEHLWRVLDDSRDDKVDCTTLHVVPHWVAYALLDDAKALQAERATLTAALQQVQARNAALEAELAETMRECVDFTISYGIGDEDRYRARYRELTGRDYDEGDGDGTNS